MSVNSGTMVFAMLLEERIRGPWFSRWCLEPANSGTMVFAMVLEPANTGTMVFAMVLETANSRTMVFAIDGFGTSEFGDHGICDGFGTTSKRQKHPRVFTRAEVRYHAICGVFKLPDVGYRAICGVFQAPRCPLPCYLRCFSGAQMSVTMLFAVFSSAQMSVTMLFAVFSSTQMSVTVLIAVFPSVTMLFALFSSAQMSSAQMSVVPGVLRLYHKSRLSSHGSSGCPRRTTSVLQKSTFQPRKLAAYYVCATKVDFLATEAPRVRGVLRLYYKSRLSSHGSSGCPRRTTSVLQK